MGVLPSDEDGVGMSRPKREIGDVDAVARAAVSLFGKGFN